jgi:UDP-N-acetylglucosamine 1-carboxyvinyltransferase|tara:strand:- start:390 stop:1640 length:1251 start_codon:yes stop_codon:yes gene_type:complete
MDIISIIGPNQLKGSVKISGAKNAVLPLMTACIIHPGNYKINNVPMLKDTLTMCKLLEMVGAKVKIINDSVLIDTKNCNSPLAPYELVKTMRASFYVLGPFMARFGEAQVSLPGGCAWGPRPVDFHIKALEKMGAQINLDGGYINAKGKLKGADITFAKSSVGATGNVLMAAIKAKGTTRIFNSAKEPEIDCLIEFLNLMGGNIIRDKNEDIIIKGVLDLKDNIEIDVIPDRIEAGTFMIAAAITKGNITLTNVNPNHLEIVIDKLRACGCVIEISNNTLNIKMFKKPISNDMVTDIYPGFPTDLQAQWMALMCLAKGVSKVIDNIYIDRFTHVAELIRLGAKIELEKNIAKVSGVDYLSAAEVMSTDIRASASLVLSGLIAKGNTKISRVYHIDRGYERIEEKFKKLNADINRLK